MKNFELSTLSSDEQLYLQAKAKYYNGEFLLSDEEFDILEDRLKSQDSFVVDIVGTISIKNNKVAVKRGKIVFLPHNTLMGSLAKIQFKPNYVPYNEFKHWLNQIPTTVNECKIEFGPKLDGNAINLIYKDGNLINVLSRGDGQEGQDYTKQFSNNVPKYIKDFTGEIRGEAVIDTYLFDTVYGPNSGIAKPYANARNFVAGALTKGDINVCKDIDFVAFQIVGYVGNTKTQLIKWGFNVLDYIEEINYNDIDLITFEKIYAKFKYYRENCKYQLDGYVAKMQESVRTIIGETSHHPNWALAIKFETKAVYTTIVDIEYNLGKNGQLAPVAILEPVELLGSIVTRASVYNADWMIKNNCYPGAVISLIKSGDIIPRIVEVIEPSKHIFNLPTIWNNHELYFDGVNLMVKDFENTTEYKSLKLHQTIVALGINGIGPAIANKLSNANIDIITLLSSSPELLRTLLLNSGEFKDGRELEILINNVYELTKVELWQIIYSFGYKNCGKTIAKQLSNYMSNIPYDFKGLEKNVIASFIDDNKRIDEIKTFINILHNNNVTIVYPEVPKNGLITYEMSGDYSGGTKNEFRKIVEMSGKCIHTSLNKNTNYLVTASTASQTTKMQKAEKLSISIVTYEEFIDIINNL